MVVGGFQGLRPHRRGFDWTPTKEIKVSLPWLLGQRPTTPLAKARQILLNTTATRSGQDVDSFEDPDQYERLPDAEDAEEDQWNFSISPHPSSHSLFLHRCFLHPLGLLLLLHFPFHFVSIYFLAPISFSCSCFSTSPCSCSS